MAADGRESKTGTVKSRARIRVPLPEFAALALYAAIVACAVPRHEPWVDEAQAYQLARTLPLGELFRHSLGYESSPGLWHLLLWVAIRCHAGYAGIHWMSAAIATAGAAVLLFCAPLPRWIKLPLPFTFFLVFQYAVVARNYVLFPPLLFCLAAVWPRATRRPLTVALLLGLMANVSLHALTFAAGLAVVHAVELRRRRTPLRPRLLIAAGLLIALFAFALWTAWPPPDLHAAGPIDTPPPFAEQVFARLSGALCWGIAQPMILAVPFWVVVLRKLALDRQLLYALPLLAFAAFCSLIYVQFWHAGLVVPWLFTLFWMTWPTEPRPWRQMPAHQQHALLALAAVVALQLGWAAFALTDDWRHAYSADRETAQFLAPLVARGESFAVSSLRYPRIPHLDSIGLLPYFDRNIYRNVPEPYYLWSSQNTIEQRFAGALAERPPIVLLDYFDTHPFHPAVDLAQPRVQMVEQAGYRLTHTFCGAKPERFGWREYRCHLIFER